MKKFIKENWFKISIVTIMLLVGLVVVYYLLIYIPKKETSALEIQKQQTLEQQARWDQEQASKKIADQKAAEEKAIQEQELADKNATDQKAAQDAQAAANKKTADNKAKLDNCINLATQIRAIAVSKNQLTPIIEQQIESMLNDCYHKYPIN